MFHSNHLFSFFFFLGYITGGVPVAVRAHATPILVGHCTLMLTSSSSSFVLVSEEGKLYTISKKSTNHHTRMNVCHRLLDEPSCCAPFFFLGDSVDRAEEGRRRGGGPPVCTYTTYGITFALNGRRVERVKECPPLSCHVVCPAAERPTSAGPCRWSSSSSSSQGPCFIKLVRTVLFAIYTRRPNFRDILPSTT